MSILNIIRKLFYKKKPNIISVFLEKSVVTASFCTKNLTTQEIVVLLEYIAYNNLMKDFSENLKNNLTPKQLAEIGEFISYSKKNNPIIRPTSVFKNE